MKKKELVVYCVGGIGNRLRPLSSAYSIAKQTNRELKMIWPSVLRCLAPYDEIFCTDIKRSSMEELKQKSSVSIYALNDAIDKERYRNNTDLISLIDKWGFRGVGEIENVGDDESEVIVVSDNNF